MQKTFHRVQNATLFGGLTLLPSVTEELSGCDKEFPPRTSNFEHSSQAREDLSLARAVERPSLQVFK